MKKSIVNAIRSQFSIFGVSILLFIFLSCKTNPTDSVLNDSVNPQLEAINGIRVADNLVVFQDLPTLFSTAIKYQQDGGELKNSLKSKKFISLKDIYNEIVAEESYFHEHPESISEEQKNSLLSNGYMGSKAAMYSNMFTFNQDDGIIMKTPYPGLAVFLSPKGLVKIGTKIYQFKEHTIKIIEDGDSKKMSYLEEIKSTDNSLGIQVNPIKYLTIGAPSQGGISVQPAQQQSLRYVRGGNTFSRSADNCIGNPCEFRVIGYEDFTAPSSSGGQYIHTTTLRNLKRGFLGFWYDNNQNNETGNINGHLNFRTSVFGINLSNSMPNYNVTGYGATVSASYSFTLPEVNNFLIDSGFIFSCPSVSCQLD